MSDRINVSSSRATSPVVANRGPATPAAAPAKPDQVVAQAVTSPTREGLTPLPEGWKVPVQGMYSTPASHQRLCQADGLSARDCRDAWNRDVDQQVQWNSTHAPVTGPSSPVKPTAGETLQTGALLAAIRVRDGLARLGVTR